MSILRKATAPFGASEIEGSVAIDLSAGFWSTATRFLGPAFLVAVGYMDPGNWATDIEAGSRFGFHLLFVVGLSSLAAILFQCLSLRLGIVTGRDLAQVTRDTSGRAVTLFMWGMAEISIIACDLAEVLGGALAFHLLLHVPLMIGVLLTVLDTLIVLGLRGRNFRVIEAIILGLILTIGVCFALELLFIKLAWMDVLDGFVPSMIPLEAPFGLPLAVGIIGATIMPHNLYLHSSVVQTRRIGDGTAAKKQALRLSTLDTSLALVIALIINCAILVVAAGAFHGQSDVVADIADAYRLLKPLTGSTWAPFLFALALLASGQSSTLTGTVAGQVILEGFLHLKMANWQRRLITRALALVPAFLGVLVYGDQSLGHLLVASQIVLSLQLPFAMFPLIRRVQNRNLMGKFAISSILASISWLLFGVIVAANLWLMASFFL